MKDLVEQLKKLKVEGPSFGAPYVAISHNDITRAIVAHGEEIIPVLIQTLENCSLSEAVFIVFCLRELHAKSAKERVKQLQESHRFNDTEKDLTLDLQIQFFLRDVDSW